MKAQFVFLFTLIITTHSFSQTAESSYQQALRQVREGNIRGAKTSLESAVKAEHALAHYLLGCIYYYGDQYKGDYFEPISQLIDNSYAGYNNDGHRDISEAFSHFHSAADAGAKEGMHAVGVMYEKGWALTEKYMEAKDAFFSYAKKNQHVTDGSTDAELFRLISEMKAASREKVKDYSKALLWYEKAANLGYPPSMFSAARIYILGSEEVARDESKGVYWLKKGTESGHSESMVGLAKAYEEGFHVSKDPRKAMELYKNSMEISPSPSAEQGIDRMRLVLELDEKGQLRDYDEAGNLIQLTSMKDGKPHGEYFKRYPNGTSEKGEYNNGAKHGKWQNFDDDGTVWLEQSYINGKLDGAYNRYESGKVTVAGFYKSDRRIGEWKNYYPDGTLKKHEMLNEDGTEGLVIEYYENGKIKEKGNIRIGRGDGVKEGIWNFYNEKGKSIRQETFKYGKRVT